MMNTRNKPSSTVRVLTVLVDLRRDLEAILQRVDIALGDLEGSPHSSSAPRRFQIPVAQTFPDGTDFRGHPDALRSALGGLQERTQWVQSNLSKFSTGDLHQEMCVLAARARLIQVQTEEGSREWETAVGVIRSLTRIVADTKPGFVYGLASTHNTDWGAKIQDLLKTYRPVQ